MTEGVPAILPEDKGRLLGDAGLPDILPSSIAGDETMRHIAAAIEEEMILFSGRFPSVLLWSAISVMKEPLLTHVAVLLHTDWWDEDWTIEQKRTFLFRQILLHRKKGTCWAVEEAVSLVYGEASVREWFEYGGDRGCFTLDVAVKGTGLSDAAIRKIELMVEKFKRKSQHLCGLYFSLTSSGTLYSGGSVFVDDVLTIHQYSPDDLDVPESPARVASALDILETYTLNQSGVAGA